MYDAARPRRIAAIVCAAGSGTRFGAENGSKLDADLHGQPVLIRSVAAFANHREISRIVVAGPAEPDALAKFREHHAPALKRLNADVCRGGRTERFETVRAALDHLLRTTPQGEQPDAVLVHDAARPCTPNGVIRAVIEGLRLRAAVVPAVPISDTIRRARPHEAAPTASTESPTQQANKHVAELGEVESTVDRRGLFACQTPQGFSLPLLERAYSQADLPSTDDAQLVERLGESITLVAGDPCNLKITHPADLDLARAIWPTLGG